MIPTKTQIKKVIVKKIEVNTSIPAEAIPELLRESYINFIVDLSTLKNDIFKSKDFELKNDCIIFETDRPYYYEIQSNGHLIDISRQVWADHFDRIRTEEEALKS
jgi:hypothetical protein